jgi:hypothetical protein
MPDLIRLTWYVKNQHTETFTPDGFAEWVRQNHLDVNPEDLDEVYNVLDSGDWRAEEALFDLAADRNWLDSSSAEIADIGTEPAEVTA